MRKILAVCVLFSCQILRAQSPNGPATQTNPLGDPTARRLQQDAFEKWSLEPDASKKATTAKEAEAAQEFYSKARQFVDLWQAFAAELNDKKTFNAKLAKQVSKAFHELEKSDGWPIGRQK